MAKHLLPESFTWRDNGTPTMVCPKVRRRTQDERESMASVSMTNPIFNWQRQQAAPFANQRHSKTLQKTGVKLQLPLPGGYQL
jgi:hypothetical protein